MDTDSTWPRRVRPRGSPVQRRSQATVERILDASARLFDEYGYEGTTTKQVAAEARISIGALYRYFPNKDALVAALGERQSEDLTPELYRFFEELDRDEPGPEELARRLVRRAADANPRAHQRMRHDAPTTRNVQRQIDDFEEYATRKLGGHLRRFGHAHDVATARARVVAVAIFAVVHHEPTHNVASLEQLTSIVAAALARIAPPPD